MPKILEQTKGWMGILTSRGCPYKCTYCFNLEIVDQYVADGAAKGPKGVPAACSRSTGRSQELKDLRRRYPQIKTFIFDDDLFTLNKPYVQKFCKAYREADVGLPYVVNGHVNCFDEAVGARPERVGLHDRQVRAGERATTASGATCCTATCRTRRSRRASPTPTSTTCTPRLRDVRPAARGPAEILDTLELCARVKMGRFRWAIFFPFKGHGRLRHREAL
jgi:hypothetical protein